MTDTDKLTRASMILGALVTAGTMVWQLSGIAHDVGEVKVAVAALQQDEKAKDTRLDAVENRVSKLETTVSLWESYHGKASSASP